MNQGLKRNPRNKVIAGVCSGLADHLKLDPTLVRLIFVLLAIFAFGGVIVYVVLWVILPEMIISQITARKQMKMRFILSHLKTGRGS